MLSLFYTSRSRLNASAAAEQLRAILAIAQPRNRRHGITGALVFTGRDFAQILEGSEKDVASVMGSILIDPRHDEVGIVRREIIERRFFPAWSMNLIEHDPSITAHLDAIRSAPGDVELAEAIDSAMARMRYGYVPADA